MLLAEPQIRPGLACVVSAWHRWSSVEFQCFEIVSPDTADSTEVRLARTERTYTCEPMGDQYRM